MLFREVSNQIKFQFKRWSFLRQLNTCSVRADIDTVGILPVRGTAHSMIGINACRIHCRRSWFWCCLDSFNRYLYHWIGTQDCVFKMLSKLIGPFGGCTPEEAGT